MAHCPKHPERECAPKRTRCQECLDKLRGYQQKRREQRRATNRCVGTVTRSDCAQAPRPGRTMCEACAAVFNKYQLDRIAARKGSK